MFKAALLGREIGYTKSPAVHKAIADAIGISLQFDVFDVPYDRLGEAVDRLIADYDGFFVTKPYKTDIKRFVSAADEAVNLVRSSDKTAFNTDGIGFIRALDRNFTGWRDKVNAVLVLGTGGAARSIIKELTALDKKVYVLGRSAMNAARLAAKFDGAEMYFNQHAQMIVNCTPLGFNGEDAMFALCVLPTFEYAFDLVYSDRLTPFLRRNRNAGASVADGTDMLIYQAIEGDNILLNGSFDVDKVYDSAMAQLIANGDFRGDR